MKRDLIKLMGGILLGGAATLAVLSACGGSTARSIPAPATSQPRTTIQPTPTATPTPIATVVAQAPTPPAGSSNSELLAQGKLIFEKTAGGVGCAYCHGLDGKGNGPAGVGAPPNRGKTEEQLRHLLEGGETASGNPPMMSFIKLTDEEITAVVAYLQWLDTQP